MHNATLVTSLINHAQKQPDRVSQIFLPNGEDEDEKLTFGELDLKIKALAAELQDKYKKGDRAILLFPPGLEFVISFMACLYSGILPVPVFSPHKSRIHKQLSGFLNIVNDCHPIFILTQSDYRLSTSKIFDKLPELSKLTWECSDFASPYSASSWKHPNFVGSTLAFIQYTSGSTGNPRGVVVTHDNLVHNLTCIEQYFETSTDSRVVSWLPPYHDMGLIGCILQPIFVGFLTIMMPPMSFLQRPFRWLKAITKYQATSAGGPSFAYDLCVKRVTPEQRSELDLSSWDMAFNGAEVIYMDTLRKFNEYFKPCGFRSNAFFPCYGLAESTLIVSGINKSEMPVNFNLDENIYSDLKDKKISPVQARVGCGYPIFGTTVRIVNPESKIACLDQEIGEVWVHSPSIAQSYYNKTEESERTFKASIANSDEGPFLRTGDLGFMREGQLYITGRIKNLIICNGINHYATDIEETVLQCHEAITDNSCAAFSIDVGTTEKLVVMAEMDIRYFRRHHETTHKQVEQAIINAISLYHQIRVHDIVLMDNKRVPKTTSGKIKRHAAKDDYLLQYGDKAQSID